MTFEPKYHLHCTVKTFHSIHALKCVEMCKEHLEKKMGTVDECEKRIRARWSVYALDNILNMEIYSETREQADPKNANWDELAARAFQKVGNAPFIGPIVRRAPLAWIKKKIQEFKLSTVEFEELFPAKK